VEDDGLDGDGASCEQTLAEERGGGRAARQGRARQGKARQGWPEMAQLALSFALLSYFFKKRHTKGKS